MKFHSFPFGGSSGGNKKTYSAKDATRATPQASTPTPKMSSPASSPTSDDGRRQIIFGLIFIAVSFLGAVFLLYLAANAQRTKEAQLRDMKQELVLITTEKELLDTRAKEVSEQVGRVIDIDKVVAASEKVYGPEETDRKQGSLWVNRKAKACMVTLGALNGVSKGSRLGVYDGEGKFATVKIVSALDVVSYAEPVDKELKDFTKDYYAVKVE